MKRVTLCADDFGMHPDISEAITTLALNQRIQATSALVTAPHCQQGAGLADSFHHLIDIGLHLNFTEGRGLTPPFQKGFPGLLSMLWRSHCRLLSEKTLANEIHAQLDRFETLFGAMPDFIDGHQHVHHLPQVRQALLSVLKERQYSDLWLRSVAPMVSNGSPLKSSIIERSGALSFRTIIENSPHQTNRAFAGVYSLSEDEPYDELMGFWLNQLSDNSLIMCHPGLMTEGQEVADHAAARLKEFTFLNSRHFIHAIHSAGVTLSRLRR